MLQSERNVNIKEIPLDTETIPMAIGTAQAAGLVRLTTPWRGVSLKKGAEL